MLQVLLTCYHFSFRCMFGTEAYITFTMDKIISTIGRQLQSMASDEVLFFNGLALDFLLRYFFD